MHNHSTDYTTTHVHPTSDLTAKGHAHGRCVSDGAEGGGGGGSGTGGGGEGGVGGIGEARHSAARHTPQLQQLPICEPS